MEIANNLFSVFGQSDLERDLIERAANQPPSRNSKRGTLFAKDVSEVCSVPAFRAGSTPELDIPRYRD